MTRRLALILLLALAPLVAHASTPAAAGPVEGRDYALIEGGAPWQPFSGQIEVVEVFSYACHHCANFQPMVEGWKPKLGKDVDFTYVPLPYHPQDAFALGFFATQADKRFDRAHSQLFRAIHQQKALPRNPSIDEMATWYGEQGLDAKRVRAAMADPATRSRMASARQFAERSDVQGTPSIIIDGRYRILGNSFEELLRNADAVIAMIRAQRQPAATR